MYQDLKKLFGSEVPSVRKFVEKLSKLSAEEQEFYYMAAYHTAFCEWLRLGVRYRLFLHDLIQHDWQRSLNFLLNCTIMGTLRYPLQEHDLVIKLIALLEGKKKGYTPSYNHLAFSIQLAFPNFYKLSTFGDKLRTIRLDTDELLDLLARVKINNIDEE